MSSEQLLELVSQLLAENERLRAEAEIDQLRRKKSHSAAPFSETSARRILNVPDVNPVKGHSTAAFSAFKSVIGALKKGGGNVLEKLTNLIASATSQETAPANTS